MKTRIKISLYIFVYFFTLVANNSYAQDEELPIPPSYEKTKNFSLLYVDRQPTPPKHIIDHIKKLELLPRQNWNSKDSLIYSFELIYLGQFNHALSYLSKLRTDTIRENDMTHLLQLTYRKTGRWDRLRASILRGSESSLIKDIRLRLVDVREIYEKGTWDTEKNKIFPILKDSVFFEYSKNTKKYFKYLIPTAKNYKDALLVDVKYVDGNDIILSEAFEELGDFFHEHLYLTNSYMAYSISRKYDKRNATLAKKLKMIKSKMDQKKILQPSLRENFSIINYDKYNFRIIADFNKKKVSENERIVTAEEVNAQRKKNRDYIPWLDYDLAIILTMLALFIFSLFLLKTK